MSVYLNQGKRMGDVLKHNKKERWFYDEYDSQTGASVSSNGTG